jgi:hypothetical protein
MKTLKNLVLFLSFLMTGVALQAASPEDVAVTCDKCKIVVVKDPIRTGYRGQHIIYQEHKRMVCPDCVSAIENFFTTGKLKHTCSHCGGEMTVCIH